MAVSIFASATWALSRLLSVTYVLRALCRLVRVGAVAVAAKGLVTDWRLLLCNLRSAADADIVEVDGFDARRAACLSTKACDEIAAIAAAKLDVGGEEG